jgi:hypothetical protein
VKHPSRRTHLVHDTLCVNKLYRTDFLREHGIRFPEGRFPYEDFVFTARVLAAGPRIALIPDTVYVWHVRRGAERLSISLDRAGVGNWRSRITAHALSYDILLAAGEKRLARATRARFLDHSLRMYARELDQRGPVYRREWWALTRAYLATFDAADLALAPAPGRVVAQVVTASEEPRDLTRVKEVAARPARLRPPYARLADGTPVWSADLTQVTLEHLLFRPVRLLPVAVDAELRPRARATRLRLRLHELYGRMADAAPATVDAEFVNRHDGAVGLTVTAEFLPDDPDPSTTARATTGASTPGRPRRPSTSRRSAPAPGTCAFVCASTTARAARPPRTPSRARACCAGPSCATAGTGCCSSSRTRPTRARSRCDWRPAGVE